MSTTDRISCPTCGTSIRIEDALAHDIEERLRRDHAEQLATAIAQATAKASEESSAQAQAQLRALQDDLATRDRQLHEFRQLQVSALAMEQRLRDQEASMELLVQKRVLEAQSELESRIRQTEKERATMEREAERARVEARAREEHERLERTVAEMRERAELDKRELQMKLDDATRRAEDMRRRLEQGSQQLQGEAQELVIEDFLRSEFPFDTVDAVGKGQRGGDCLHVVCDRMGRPLGSIYYESKRTKAFGGDWTEKLRADMRSQRAEIGVIVTETMPKGMERFGLHDGVWICSVSEFRGLCHVLRDMVRRVAEAGAAQEHRGDKMAMLYDYLTGSEFRQQFEAIVEGFVTMKGDLDAERRAMERLWKQREKQLEKVLDATSHLYGSIRGIAGNAIGSVAALELPAGPDVQ